VPDLSLPEQLFERFFNLSTGTLHEFYCPTCGKVTEHFGTTHSGLQDKDLKFLSRLFDDLTGLGNPIVGKPYVCAQPPFGRSWHGTGKPFELWVSTGRPPLLTRRTTCGFGATKSSHTDTGSIARRPSRGGSDLSDFGFPGRAAVRPHSDPLHDSLLPSISGGI
jgi:hypothetical protein